MLKFSAEKRELLENFWTVFTSFGYTEIEKTDSFSEDVKTPGKYCYLEKSEAGVIETGSAGQMARAEKAAMCIEAAAAAGMEDVILRIGDDDVEFMLTFFGLEDYVEFVEGMSGFEAVLDDTVIAKGYFEEDCCGFSFDVEQTMKCAGLIASLPKASLLYCEEDGEGYGYELAYNLRLNGCIIEMYTAGGDFEDAQGYAKEKGITCVMHVTDDGRLTIKDDDTGEFTDTTVVDFIGYHDYGEEDDCGCGHHHHGEDCGCH